MDLWLSVLIFFIAYAFIVAEKIHRTVTALVGGTLVVALGIITQKEAFTAIDFNTIGLLVGMMIIVGITRQSGVFEYLAVKSVKLVGGKPPFILVALALVTAIASALLDNVTTVLLIVPVTYSIADRLNVPAFPFVFAEILASNIGGTSTLIGDPPNIMIGSATGLGFLDFIINLGPIVAIIMIITLVMVLLIFRNQLTTDKDNISQVMELDEFELIREWSILKKSLLVLGLTILGFALHQALNLESATIALLGASLLMLITAESPEEILLTVEWPTIFFFAGLFVIVGGLEATGAIQLVAEKSLDITHGNLMETGLLVLWLSAAASAFVDNIPFTATMIPLLHTIGDLTQMPMESIWWALALGACLGGNGSLVGAAANVIVVGIAEKHGDPIRFIKFLKWGFPLMLMSIALSSLYLYLLYWR